MTEEEGHKSVSVVDSVNFFALQEAKNVVLNDRVLSHSS